MDYLNLRIKKLKNYSFFLFLIPTVALIGSLLISNLLIGFNFKPGETKFVSYKNERNSLPLTFECNKDNNFCINLILPKHKKLNLCNEYLLISEYSVNEKKYPAAEFLAKFTFQDGKKILLKKEYENNIIRNKISHGETKNKNCIINSKFYFIYKIIPQPFNFIKVIKENKKYVAATSITVNPLLDGQTSISNVVKRFPINLIFKPLLYITIILMILYWFNNKKILSKILTEQKPNKFFIFGIASSIFLFLHIIFLGMETDIVILKKLKRLIIVLFVLCEVIAQFLLVRKLYKHKNLLNQFIHKNILSIKIIFVGIILFVTVLILLALTFYNLPSTIDYILEWNYFLILLIFYLLTSLMWKKKL